MDQIKRKNYIRNIQLAIITSVLLFPVFAWAQPSDFVNPPDRALLPATITPTNNPGEFTISWEHICRLHPEITNIGFGIVANMENLDGTSPQEIFSFSSSFVPCSPPHHISHNQTIPFLHPIFNITQSKYVSFIINWDHWLPTLTPGFPLYKILFYFDFPNQTLSLIIPPPPPPACSIYQQWHSCNMAGCCWRIGPEGLFPALDGCVPCSDFPQLCAEGPWGCQWCPQTECQALAGCHWDADKQFCGLGPTPCSGINLHACHTQAECEHWLGYWDAATQKCLTGPPLQPPTYTDPDFGLMGNWVRDVLKFLFMPDFDRIRRSFLTFFQTIRTRFPFAYFYQGYDIIRGIQNNPTPVFPADVAFAFYGQTVPLFSWSFFDSPTFAPIAQIMKTIITFFIWFSVFDYVIFRIKTTDVGV